MLTPPHRTQQRLQPQAGPSTDIDPITAFIPLDVPSSRTSRSRLPVPLLHGHSRSMNAVPTARALADAADDRVGAPSPSSSPGLGSRATKLLAVMRRSSSYNHRRARRDLSERGMFSTPEERLASSSSPARDMQPPSIAQIAMGLHMSRTPHLGPTHTRRPGSEHGGPRSAARPRTSSPPLANTESSSSTRVAPPLRSSMKNPSISASSSPHFSRSTSPSASASSAPSVPSTPRSGISRISLRSRLDRFLGRGARSTSTSTSITSLTSSSDSELSTPRKSVRFVSIAEDETDSKVVM